LGADLRAEAARLVQSYQAELEELAQWCLQQGLADEAQQTRSWLVHRDPYKIYVIQLPVEVGPAPPPENLSPQAVEWYRRLQSLKQRQADRLFDLARRAIRSRQASLAFDLVMAALRENPDHAGIRRLLGYQRYRGQWRTAYEADRLRKGQLWDDQFGWLPRSHVRRYHRGERYYRGRWISAQQDAQLRADIHTGWDVETEHYRVRTNHSIQAGVRLATRLEELYRVWKQLFIRYYATADQVAALFDASPRATRIRRMRPIQHRVVYFRDRQAYNQALQHVFPNIEISVGVYLDQSRTAYFFADDESDDRTLLHEATHQLFHETRPVASAVGRDHNFWIIEGVAMYMETLRTEDGYHVVGGFDDDRIVAARYRLLHDGFYVPLAELTSYGMAKLQSDPRIRTLYSQAAGLAHFLVHYDGGRYRDALVAYLRAVYTGQDDPNTLVRLTGTSYSQLDQQYRQYMKAAGPAAQ